MIHSLALVEVTQNLRERKIACHQLRDRRRGEQDRNARIWQSTAGLTEGGEVISETAGKSCDTPPSNTDHVIIGSSVRVLLSVPLLFSVCLFYHWRIPQIREGTFMADPRFLPKVSCDSAG